MEVLLRYLDPVLLDEIYEPASLLAESICGNETRHSSIFATVTDKGKQKLCLFAADPDLWQRHGLARQSISVFFLTWLSSSFLYLLFGTICYYRYFDRTQKKQPKFRPNQLRSEITDSLWTLLGLNVLTVPIFVAQVRGFAKIYTSGSGSVWYEMAQYPFFILFSDTCMYWLHRVFHHPLLFKIAHHKHHRFVIPTPFSAYAFDPLEAYIMSLPIYAYSFIWPMSDVAQLVVFFFTNIWTFLLHDNRDQFHTIHHKSINFNFGQFLTLWDRLGGTYIDPGVFFKPVNKRA